MDDIYADVYSEHFYMERALLPIFQVYKLKGISKKLAVMLSMAKDPNGDRWNRLFDLCQEVRTSTGVYCVTCEPSQNIPLGSIPHSSGVDLVF